MSCSLKSKQRLRKGQSCLEGEVDLEIVYEDGQWAAELLLMLLKKGTTTGMTR